MISLDSLNPPFGAEPTALSIWRLARLEVEAGPSRLTAETKGSGSWRLKFQGQIKKHPPDPNSLLTLLDTGSDWGRGVLCNKDFFIFYFYL